MPGVKNPFYAKVEDKVVQWGEPMGANVKIQFTSSSNSQIIEVGTDKLKLVGKPDNDTEVILSATISGLGNETNRRDITIAVNVKAASPIEKELRGYLDKYLTVENMKYTTIKKDGVNFTEDYNLGNVRYSFKLPTVTELEGIPYGTVKTEVTSISEGKDVNKVNTYVWDPIRNDVGGKAKTFTINYKLTKDGISASKDINITVPALTEKEINDEIDLLQEIKADIFDGMKGQNFDKNSVSKSLTFVNEVNYDKEGKLVWTLNAHNKKYYGFKFTESEGFDVVYPDGDKAVFSPTNLVLERRPDKDIRATITHNVESIQLEKYAALYPENKLLQQIKKQPVSVDVIVKKLDPTVKTIKIGEQIFNVNENKTYSYLTESTLDAIMIEAELNNQSAELIIEGSDVTNVHKKKISLADGYKRISINVSDEDDKEAGTKITESYNVIVASKAFLEEEIAKLPGNSKEADSQALKLANKLWQQYYLLSKSDKEKIKGFEKLTGYENYIEDPLKESKEQVKKVCDNLFEGIKGDKNVNFVAKVTHLSENSVTSEANINLNLKAYNGNLEKVTINEFPDFSLTPGKYDYTVFNNNDLEKITLNYKTLIPNAEVRVNDSLAKQNGDIDVSLKDGAGVIKLTVNDGTKNTLNDKWDEKNYTIAIISSISQLDQKMQQIPKEDKISRDNYKNYLSDIEMLRSAYNTLTEEQKKQITSGALDSLVNAEKKIQQIQLEEAKNNSILELKAYETDSTQYEKEQWNQVLAAKADGENQINKSQTIEEVKKALSDTKAFIASIDKKDQGEVAMDAKIKTIAIIPGDIKASLLEGNKYTVKIPNDQNNILIKAEPNNRKAKVTVDGETVNFNGNWTNKNIISIDKDKGRDVEITVISSNGQITETYTVNVTRQETVKPDKNTINVSFTLIGDSKHGKPENHTSFETWISKSNYTVNKGTTLKYLTDKVLIDNNIPFIVKGGTYVSSIKGLAELDNGPKSGWMFKINGKITDLNYEQTVLEDGDSVVWFYTDDYSKEKEIWTGNGIKSDKKVSIDVPAEFKDGVATSTLDKVEADRIIEKALQNENSEVIISATHTGEANKINIVLSKTSIKHFADKLKQGVKVTSSVGHVYLEQNVLNEIASKAEGENIIISLNKSIDPDKKITSAIGKDAYILEVNIESQGNNFTKLTSGFAEIIIEVPESLKNNVCFSRKISSRKSINRPRKREKFKNS